MKKRFLQTWQQLRASFSVRETLSTTVETGQAVLEAAKTFQEQGASIELLKPLLQNSSSLLDVLCSPLAQVVGAGLPFVPLGIALLKFSRDITKQDPSLEDCVFIVTQAAYLESVKEILSLYPSINRDADPNINETLTKQLQKLNDIELDSQSASNAVACFHESELAKAFNAVLLERLQAVSIPDTEPDILTQRVAWNTNRYIMKAWIDSGDAIKNRIQPSFGEWQKEQQKFSSIDEYLKDDIASKPLEQVFDEKFSFQDIYVPLKAKPVDKNGEIELEKWAKDILLNPNNLEQVMFVQGGPGRGKSVFCRIFADWVRKHLHPIWTPILIRLRDINSFEYRLENTLKAELQISFIQNDQNWLTNKNTRFLFILDGFDELHIEARTTLNLGAFIKQVSDFQKSCKSYSDMGHRVLITGRSMSLQGIPDLPHNLERVEIVEMDGQLQQKWLDKWEELPANKAKTPTFGQFLQNNKCPSEVKKLAQEPLLLYLLAAMYRDGKLAIDKLEQASQRTTKIVIYQEALNWVLTKQRSEADGTNLNIELTQQKPENLKRILLEAAVCVVQSGGESASMSMLEARLQDDKTARALIDEARKKLSDTALKTALAAFYIRPADKQEGGVEFYHKSFGEFLFAERLKVQLKAWTEYEKTEEKQLVIPEDQMNWQIYDLLGFGRLTPEIVEYLMGLLTENQDYPWEQLFKRLEKFYGSWCKGKFIDSVKETLKDTLPQKKLRQLEQYGIQELGQRQVDIYAGLNVMILLLKLHQYAQGRYDLKKQIIFYPSGQPQENSCTTQLLRIINYSDCIQLGTFNTVVGQFLNSTDLSRAYLSRAYLSGVDLSDANLSDANLSGSDLRDTNLRSVDIRGANLSDANLSDANLSGAKLRDANLRSVNLIGAYLSGADLSSADLSGAYLSRAYLSGAYLRETKLSGANLSGTNLSGTDLRDADLSAADLSAADLRDADLRDADLKDANLSGANLSRANLRGANLTRADLRGADLSPADISGANFMGANLSSADLSSATLSDKVKGDIRWDKNTKWDYVKGLDTARNVPEVLKQQLGLR